MHTSSTASSPSPHWRPARPQSQMLDAMEAAMGVAAVIGALVALVAGALAIAVWKCFHRYSVVVQQLPGASHVQPFWPLLGIWTMRVGKLRPCAPLYHGSRRFPGITEMNLAAFMPTKAGKPARWTAEQLVKLPATEPRSVVGDPSYGPMVYFFGTSVRLQTAEPDILLDILVRKASYFEKPSTMKYFIGRLLGPASVLLTEGDTHALQRRLVAKAFAFDMLKAMTPIFGRCAADTVGLLAGPDVPPAWLYRADRYTVPVAPVEESGPAPALPARFRDCPVVDASAAMSGLTLEIIAQSAFGGAFGSGEGGGSAAAKAAVPGTSGAANIVKRALKASIADSYAVLTRLPFVAFVPWLERFAYRPEAAERNAAQAALDELSKAVIVRRRAEPEAASGTLGERDLLGLMISSSTSHAELEASRAEYSTGADAADASAAVSGVSASDAHSGKPTATAPAPEAGPARAPAASPAPSSRHTRASTLRMSDSEIRDQAITFVLAGHETTSQLLTWTIFCLSQAPEWQGRLHAEAAEFLGRPAGLDGFAKSPSLAKALPICEAILHETMRLYPPAGLIARNVVADVRVGKEGRLLLPRGLEVTVPIAAAHRQASLFPDPDDFDPARWLDDDVVASLGMRRLAAGGLGAGDDPVTTARPRLAALSPYQFLPFSAGPRNCVGQRFALMEARVALTALAARVEWALDPSYRHGCSVRITSVPLLGMPVRFRARD